MKIYNIYLESEKELIFAISGAMGFDCSATVNTKTPLKSYIIGVDVPEKYTKDFNALIATALKIKNEL